MTEHRHREWSRDWSDSPKPESASKGGKRASDERERERAGQIDKSQEDKSRGNRGRDPFRDERDRASAAGRKSSER